MKLMTGHAYERANICANCGGVLKIFDHWHEREGPVAGAEPICCKCKRECPVGADDFTMERVLRHAAELSGTFSLQSLTVHMAGKSDDALWYRLQDFLSRHPERFRRVTRQKWEVIA